MSSASKVGRRAEELSYLLIANGAPDTPPASGFLDWLLARGASVTLLLHPLTAEAGGEHRMFRYREGRLTTERHLRLPSRPPATFPLDLIAPPLLPAGEVTIAFNNMHAARAMLSRPRRTVVYSAVDFVPNRFGAGTRLTRAYEALDRWVCGHAAARFELSQTTLESRNAALKLSGRAAIGHVAPIGVWLDRVPRVPVDGHARRRVIFIGHLVERMGVDTFLDAIALLRSRNVPVHADVTGRGPLEGELRQRAERAGIGDHVTWHGFIPDHRDLEAVLASATIAVAPYSTRVESFTRFADASKLKSYMAAGLPILLTDVPPNAGELVDQAGAEIVQDSAEAFAGAIERLLADEQLWLQRRAAALAYVRQFDWNVIVPNALEVLGIG